MRSPTQSLSELLCSLDSTVQLLMQLESLDADHGSFQMSVLVSKELTAFNFNQLFNSCVSSMGKLQFV